MESNLIPYEMKSDFSKLAETICQLSNGHQLYYLPNPGNLGDAIIRVGTEQFLRDFGINASLITRDDHGKVTFGEHGRTLSTGDLRNGILLFGGGGGWCSIWQGGQEIVSQLAPKFHHTIVLPSTYEITPNIPNTTFFSRDKYESMLNAPFSSFCHDLGFYVRPDTINSTPIARTGFCFRKDQESGFERKWHIPLSNHDISWTGDYLSNPKPMFEYLANFKVIHTDRLHVAIACCLIGVKVFLYPGAYFKNRAIFMSSIAPYFDGVKWRRRLPIRLLLLSKLQRKFTAKERLSL